MQIYFKPYKFYIKIILLLCWINFTIAAPVVLNVNYKTIIINGKSKQVATIVQNDGTWGYTIPAGQKTFSVIVKNNLNTPTVIHWHGLILPNNQDGVPGLTQAPIPPHQTYSYNFPIKQVGTYWMHSHFGLQEQDYVEAPLIIETPQDKKYQQVMVMFQDFSYKSPEQIYKGLLPGCTKDCSKKPMMMNMKQGSMGPDLTDVIYDDYLTNYRSGSDPQITLVKSGKQVKLRFINGSAQTNFWVNLGKLKGTLIAIDGQDIIPINGTKFQLAGAKRLDIIVTIPKKGGEFPILGQVEGLSNQTGMILSTTPNPQNNTIKSMASSVNPALNYNQDLKLHSLVAISKHNKPIILQAVLTGNMSQYIWQINGQTWPKVTPLTVTQGQRVQLVIKNNSIMAHPMHLHGYVFKLVKINNKAINGAMNDTVLVLPNSQVTVEFIANYPGKWAFHCHMLYHLGAGMMTYLNVIPSK